MPPADASQGRVRDRPSCQPNQGQTSPFRSGARRASEADRLLDASEEEHANCAGVSAKGGPGVVGKRIGRGSPREPVPRPPLAGIKPKRPNGREREQHQSAAKRLSSEPLMKISSRNGMELAPSEFPSPAKAMWSPTRTMSAGRLGKLKNLQRPRGHEMSALLVSQSRPICERRKGMSWMVAG